MSAAATAGTIGMPTRYSTTSRDQPSDSEIASYSVTRLKITRTPQRTHQHCYDGESGRDQAAGAAQVEPCVPLGAGRVGRRDVG